MFRDLRVSFLISMKRLSALHSKTSSVKLDKNSTCIASKDKSMPCDLQANQHLL